MKLGQVFPSKYLKSDDIGDANVPVEIERVEMEEMGQGGDHRPVIYFKGKKKGFVCNKTNFTTIAKVLGSDDSDDWTGGKIILYATEVQYGNEMVMGIRVRLKTATPPKAKPVAAKAAAPADDDLGENDIPDDEIPF